MPRRYRPREITRALMRAGWLFSHQTGSHVRLVMPDGRFPVSVPRSDPQLDPGTLNSIARQCGMSGPEFRSFLEDYL